MKKKLDKNDIALIVLVCSVAFVIVAIKLLTNSMYKGNEKYHTTLVIDTTATAATQSVMAVVHTEELTTETQETTTEETQETYAIVENIEEKVVPLDKKEDALAYRKPVPAQTVSNSVAAVTKNTVGATTASNPLEKKSFVTQVLKYDSKGNILYTKTDNIKKLSEKEAQEYLSGKEVTVYVSDGGSTAALKGHVIESAAAGIRKTEVVKQLLVVSTVAVKEETTEKTTDNKIETKTAADKSRQLENVQNETKEQVTQSTQGETLASSESTTVTTTLSTKEAVTTKPTQTEKETTTAAELKEYTVYELSPITTETTVNGWYVENGAKYYYYNEDYYAVGYTDIDNFRYYFNSEGKLCSKLGIDVSLYQGNIDFAKVKQAGVDFVIVRACVRGYQYAKLSKDEKFDVNVSNALANGLTVGAYVFSQAVNEQEAAEEASLIISMCRKHKINGPVVIDVEEVLSSVARQNKISVQKRTSIIQVFEQMVREAGYTPMLYTGESWLQTSINSGKLSNMDFWIAKWSSKIPQCRYKIWQYSDCGSVPGIKGDVDMDIWITE